MLSSRVPSKNRFKCAYCSTVHSEKKAAKECYDKHQIVLLGLSRSDLNRLAQFIVTRDEELLTPSMMSAINRYNREAARRQWTERIDEREFD